MQIHPPSITSLSSSNMTSSLPPPLLCSLSSVSVQGPHQRNLLKNLLKDYNRMERPVGNDSLPLTVIFTLSLVQIMDVVRTVGLSACIPVYPSVHQAVHPSL